MLRPAALMLALMLVLTAATSALAEGAGDLLGGWTVESYNGDTPPANVQMKVEFVDADTMRLVLVVDGSEVSSQDARYSATDDGKFMRYPEESPDGISGTWSIDAAGKLRIVNDDGSEDIVMDRA
ncbi:MAG: hypothetical protein ACIAXF_07020 [Phycisphaerales bacterium JB063]